MSGSHTLVEFELKLMLAAVEHRKPIFLYLALLCGQRIERQG